MDIRGTFVPPALGYASTPIQIAGPGTLRLSDVGVEATGFKTAINVVAALLALFGVGIVVAAVYARKSFDPDGSNHFVEIAAIFAFVVVGGALTRGQTVTGTKGERPMSLSIPWANVTAVAKDSRAPGTLLLTVKKFKPAGTLHFTPEGDVDAALAALRARGAK